MLSVLHVIALVLDLPEGDAAQSVQLENEVFLLIVGGEVDVRLLAHADLGADCRYDAASRSRRSSIAAG